MTIGDRIFAMVERRSELKRRYHRKKKLRKLKNRLAATKDHTKREHILRKIKLLSPQWKEKKPEYKTAATK